MRRGPLALALALALTLGVGLLLKGSCFWSDYNAASLRGLCYSDIPPLYTARHMDNDTLPYVDHGDDGPLQERRGFVEYPVLTGLFLWSMALVGTAREALVPLGPESAWEYLHWSALFLALFAAGTALLLWRETQRSRRTLLFASAPALALYAFHNWDLLAVFFATLALYLHARGRTIGAGVATALGAASKLYPILLAPILYLHLVADAPPAPWHRRLLTPRALRYAGAVVATLLLLHLPFLFLGPELVLGTYRFHAQRLPNPETPWYAIHYWAARGGVSRGLPTVFRQVLPWVAALALVATLTLVARRIDQRRATPAAAAFALVLVFLLTNKIYSVQYALWVLPFLALLNVPVRAYVLFAVADVAVYATILPSLDLLHRVSASRLFESDAFAASYAWVTLATLLRHTSLAWLLWHALRPTRLSPVPGSDGQ